MIPNIFIIVISLLTFVISCRKVNNYSDFLNKTKDSINLSNCTKNFKCESNKEIINKSVEKKSVIDFKY